ncbi:MAG: type IIL restriction-modification enzyme MmeI [Kofleriaceae bacterium]
MLSTKPRCLANSQVSKHLVFAFQPTDRIFGHTLYVFPLDSHAYFATLQSRIHESWARLLSSSLEDRLRYSPSDCFETFPFPPAASLAADAPLEAIGRSLYDARAALMIERDCGLTVTYNQLKDPDVTDPAIDALRQLHLDLDRAVLAAYGWDDLPVPAFTTPVTDADWRAKEAFDDAIIDRLFALNAQRAAAERLLGPTAAAGKPTKSARPRKPRRAAPSAPELPLAPPAPDPADP